VAAGAVEEVVEEVVAVVVSVGVVVAAMDAVAVLVAAAAAVLAGEAVEAAAEEAVVAAELAGDLARVEALHGEVVSAACLSFCKSTPRLLPLKLVHNVLNIRLTSLDDSSSRQLTNTSESTVAGMETNH
jgi:hypothetical protein